MSHLREARLQSKVLDELRRHCREGPVQTLRKEPDEYGRNGLVSDRKLLRVTSHKHKSSPRCADRDSSLTLQSGGKLALFHVNLSESAFADWQRWAGHHRGKPALIRSDGTDLSHKAMKFSQRSTWETASLSFSDLGQIALDNSSAWSCGVSFQVLLKSGLPDDTTFQPVWWSSSTCSAPACRTPCPLGLGLGLRGDGQSHSSGSPRSSCNVRHGNLSSNVELTSERDRSGARKRSLRLDRGLRDDHLAKSGRCFRWPVRVRARCFCALAM